MKLSSDTRYIPQKPLNKREKRGMSFLQGPSVKDRVRENRKDRWMVDALSVSNIRDGQDPVMPIDTRSSWSILAFKSSSFSSPFRLHYHFFADFAIAL